LIPSRNGKGALDDRFMAGLRISSLLNTTVTLFAILIDVHDRVWELVVHVTREGAAGWRR
jgi:hypothetical protein